MLYTEPISGRPCIDVETFSFASWIPASAAGTGSGIPHLSELIDDFAGKIEVAFLHCYPFADDMASLIAVLRCAEALRRNVSSPKLFL